MIIHIGNNNYIYEKDIIVILDKKAADGTLKTREFINNLIVENKIIGNLDLNTRTYVIISDKDNKSMLYTTNISSKALLRRNNINRNY